MNNNYDDLRNDRINTIYGNYNASINRNTTKKKKKVFLFIALILVVIIASVAATTAYMVTKGLIISEDKATDYKVNQMHSKVVETSTKATEALSSPEIIKKVLPSVVGITVSSMMSSGSGSGIIFSDDGYIVTNQHVISDAQSITVTLSDSSEYEATVVGQDERTDLAVIKIKASDLPAAEVGNSDDLIQGETVLVIGNPLGETLSGSITQGIVSALGREIEVEGRIMHYLQTDAAINPGNSGGALVNAAGMVVGVTSAKISSSYTEGLGFAIPINDAVPVIEELINNGYVSGRPIIGISGENISKQVADLYNLPVGVYVRYVDPDSGAAKAGIQQGDIITAINGKDITTISELNNERDHFKAGQDVTLTIYRSGKSAEIKVILGEASEEDR